MKVVHAVHGYPPEVIGGTELYVQRLAREQRARGDAPRVFAGSLEWRPEVTLERGSEDGVPVTRIHREDLFFDRWDKGFHPRVSEAFEAFLGAERPDLLHVHHWIRLSTNLVAIAARLSIPAVVTIHDLYPTCPRVFRLKGAGGDEPCELPMGVEACLRCVPRWRFQGDDEVGQSLLRYRADMRRELELAAGVIAPSASHGRFLAAMLGFSAIDVRVLPHGMLVEEVLDRPRRGDDGKIHLGSWSHLHPLKGAHVLLAALRAARHAARFRLHLWGAASDTGYERRLHELADGLDVIFHGAYRPADLAGATIDVAVIPTLCRESYSFILDEAVRLELPVLATRSGALAERATARVRLFGQNDSVELAALLDAIAERPQLLDDMRQAPAPKVTGFEEHVKGLEWIYADALRRGVRQVPLVDHAERLREEWSRREMGFRELVRTEKWEDVVLELRERIRELEEELRRRGA